MTTESHLSHPVTPRRTYLIGRARPNAIIGRNRETGEIALIIAGAFLGMMCGLLVPVLPLRIALLTGFPLLALAAVYVPYKRRTFYKWFEINRSYKRTVKGRGAVYRSGAMEAGTRLDGREIEIGPPPGIGRITWLAAPFGPDEIAVLLHADRKTVTAAIEIEGPGVGLRDSEDQEALVDRFGTLLKHVANGDGFVTRLQMLARTLPADPDAHAKDVALRGDDRSPGLAPAVVRTAPVHGVHQQRAAPRLPGRLHALHPRPRRRGARHGPRRPRTRRQGRPGRRTRRRHGPGADRHLLPAPGGRHPGTAAARSGTAGLPHPLHVRPRPPHRPHPGHDQAERLAGRAGRHGAHLPPGQDPGVQHPRALVPRDGLGEGVADDPGGGSTSWHPSSSTPRTSSARSPSPWTSNPPRSPSNAC